MTETRYYIGLAELGRMSMKLGPAEFAEPIRPITLENGVEMFPVSREVHDEYLGDDDDVAEVDDDDL